METMTTIARPFLKWAGGKGQLLEQIDAHLPSGLKAGTIPRYVEPFIGGGAVFFHIAQTYAVDEFFLADVNEELVLAYRTVQCAVDALIDELRAVESAYHVLTPPRQKTYFYDTRSAFNAERPAIDFQLFGKPWIRRTAQMLFLNRTCFNGLFRVNAGGEFNVPFGRYARPSICHEEHLRAASAQLQRAHIRVADFTSVRDVADERTFVYFDPPYRPISKTSAFTSYSRYDFGDEAQTHLASVYRELDARGARLMLSNSDPTNENRHDRFFENAYKGFRIERVRAGRNINSNGRKRGAINELLIMNY